MGRLTDRKIKQKERMQHANSVKNQQRQLKLNGDSSEPSNNVSVTSVSSVATASATVRTTLGAEEVVVVGRGDEGKGGTQPPDNNSTQMPGQGKILHGHTTKFLGPQDSMSKFPGC